MIYGTLSVCGFVINLLPLEPVPVWTPFDCCLILIQKKEKKNKQTNNYAEEAETRSSSRRVTLRKRVSQYLLRTGGILRCFSCSVISTPSPLCRLFLSGC